MIDYQLTPWDTKSLGLKTAEYKFLKNPSATIQEWKDEIIKLEDRIKSEKVNFVFTRINSNNKKARVALQSQGYYFTECSQRVIIRNLKKFKSKKLPKITFKNYIEEDLEEIKLIAKNSFDFSRFHEDISITEKKARLRYYYWIDDLVKQKTDIKVAKVGRNIVGFSAQTIKNKKENVQLLLAGCKKGKEVFAMSLWNEILNYNKAIRTNSIEAIISASNIGIANLYSNFGFKIEETFFGFHKHL
ncbi:hypothetical protein ACOKFD_12430 [Flagellimonas sp. S174]|uniref:hypothetical protein n=1 Tax=Flagellimonas sp. S174 TaxID=3410790 RepID=UPI003BF5042A